MLHLGVHKTIQEQSSKQNFNRFMKNRLNQWDVHVNNMYFDRLPKICQVNNKSDERVGKPLLQKLIKPRQTGVMLLVHGRICL